MATTIGYTAAHEEIGRALRSVRARWRLRMALRGAAVAVALSLLVLALAAAGMERLGWSPEGVRWLRVATYTAVALLAAWLVGRPLLRRAPDERVALYLEEHEPSLDAAVISAVEVNGRGEGRGARSEQASPDLSPLAPRPSPLDVRLAEDAAVRVRAVDAGRRIEAPGLARGSALLLAAIIAGVALFATGPTWLRRGAAVVLAPWRSAAAATPYTIAVTPGNATLARGGDQRIAARLGGFGADEVTLAVRRGEGAWERIPMTAGADSAEFATRLFDISARTQYYVEAAGVRSPLFTLDVANLPAVQRIDLEYRYPAYTGLPPRTVEDGGDIAALRGTRVRLRVVPTMPVRAGRVVVEGRDTIALAAADSGALAGELVVGRPGFYKVALQGATGPLAGASLDYAIDVIDDEAPTVAIRKPGRDLKPTSLEEVFTETVAEDDYGVRRLELVYSVNGGPQRTVVLHDGPRTPKELSAGHTFFLEEMSLQPGDLVSYFARAADASPQGRQKPAVTDIYFMEVRPFGREYRQAEQGGGMPGQGEPENAFSQRQREIIAGTFNAQRDRASAAEREFRENMATLALAQGRLREQVEGVVQRMRERGVVSTDSTFQAIAAELPQAAAEMRAAEEALGKRDPNGALPAEQRALQHLLRAEASFRERQVAMNESGGGGGGGNPDAEDLADLFELETDKLRNQYETVQRGERQKADEQVDETLERLRKLAARQQQENERMREMASRLQSRAGSSSGGGGSGGEAQRQLAQEAEEMARRLERLARDRSSDELREAARRMRETASAMRRSAAAGEQGSAEGARALAGLEEARRALERSASGRLQRDARDAARRAAALAERQREVAGDVERMGAGGDRADRERRIFERKDQMTAEVEDLERTLDRMAREARSERGAGAGDSQPEAARRLQEAADAIREGRLADKLRFSKEVLRGGSAEYARNFEEQLGTSMDDLKRRVATAADAVREPDERRTARALDRARDLVRGLESMQQRMERERQGSGARDQGRGARDEGRGEEQGQGQGQGQSVGQGQGGGRSQAQGQGEGQGQAGEAAQGGDPAEGGRPQRGGDPGRASGDARPGFARGGPGMSPETLTPEELRQYARELRDRRTDAEGLRRDLARQGMDVRDLQALIARLRAMESAASSGDPEELRRLQAAVVDGFKAFEFALRRRLEGDTREPLLGNTDEVPPGFRKMVEEYYKSLARKDGGK